MRIWVLLSSLLAATYVSCYPTGYYGQQGPQRISYNQVGAYYNQAPQRAAARSTARVFAAVKEPVAVPIRPHASTRYHAQDEFGQYHYGYTNGDGQSKTEIRGIDGGVAGKYSYVDPEGKYIELSYVADKDGFRASGDHLPKAPKLPKLPDILENRPDSDEASDKPARPSAPAPVTYTKPQPRPTYIAAVPVAVVATGGQKEDNEDLQRDTRDGYEEEYDEEEQRRKEDEEEEKRREEEEEERREKEKKRREEEEKDREEEEKEREEKEDKRREKDKEREQEDEKEQEESEGQKQGEKEAEGGEEESGAQQGYEAPDEEGAAAAAPAPTGGIGAPIAVAVPVRGIAVPVRGVAVPVQVVQRPTFHQPSQPAVYSQPAAPKVHVSYPQVSSGPKLPAGVIQITSPIRAPHQAPSQVYSRPAISGPAPRPLVVSQVRQFPQQVQQPVRLVSSPTQIPVRVSVQPVNVVQVARLAQPKPSPPAPIPLPPVQVTLHPQKPQQQHPVRLTLPYPQPQPQPQPIRLTLPHPQSQPQQQQVRVALPHPQPQPTVVGKIPVVVHQGHVKSGYNGYQG